MNRPTDPAAAIKRALDREVERRFDSRDLSSTLQQAAMDARGPRARKSDPRVGPLERVPVPVQWIGVAAALIAAVLGVRSLYLEWRTGEPTPPGPAVAETTQVPGVPGSTPGFPQEETEPVEPVASPPIGAPAGGEGGADGAAAATVDEHRAPLTERTAPRETGEAGGPERSPTVAGAAPTVASALGHRQEPKTEPEAPDAREQGPAPTTVIATGAALQREAGVRIASLRLGSRPLLADVRKVHEIGATLVTVLGLGDRDAPQAPPADTDRRAGRDTPADLLADQTAWEPPGYYYVRLLVGGRFDPLLEDGYGFVDEQPRLVPLSHEEVWGGGWHGEYLGRAFDLSSLAALEGLRVEERVPALPFTVIAGGDVFRFSASAARTGAEGEHRIDLGIERVADAQRAARSRIEASLLVDDGDVVVLCVPAALLTWHDLAERLPRADMVFLVASPRFGEFAPQAPSLLATNPSEGPVLIQGDASAVRLAAERLGIEGAILFMAVVRADGSVGAVQLIGGSESAGPLVTLALGAVRQWRYLPAREDGEPVDCWVPIRLELGRD